MYIFDLCANFSSSKDIPNYYQNMQVFKKVTFKNNYLDKNKENNKIYLLKNRKKLKQNQFKQMHNKS